MYLHEEHIYLISNHAVARNPLFCELGIQLHFKRKMRLYLEPLCDILAYNLKDHEFQILVRLKNRAAFEEYFKSKDKREGHFITPESTYIFSQSMSNLQNSTVKKFNHKYNRSGTLMAGRFNRQLITSKDRVIEIIQDLNNGSQGMSYSGIWVESALKRMKAMTSREEFTALEMRSIGGRNSFWSQFKSNLVGRFEFPQNEDKYFKFSYLDRRVFNSISKHFS